MPRTVRHFELFAMHLSAHLEAGCLQHHIRSRSLGQVRFAPGAGGRMQAFHSISIDPVDELLAGTRSAGFAAPWLPTVIRRPSPTPDRIRRLTGGDAGSPIFWDQLTRAFEDVINDPKYKLPVADYRHFLECGSVSE